MWAVSGERRHNQAKHEPSLLSTGQADTSCPNLSGVAILQHLQIGLQGTGIDDLLVPHFVIRGTKQDVILDALVPQPRSLRREGDRMHEAVVVDLGGVLMHNDPTALEGHFAQDSHLPQPILVNNRRRLS